jgi:hypothetical protein
MSPCVLLCLLLLCFSCPAWAQDQETNNCHDPAAWTDWAACAAQHPHDTELQMLHALWMGLCFKVEKGDLLFEDAVRIFEHARETLIHNRQEQRDVKQPPAPL